MLAVVICIEDPLRPEAAEVIRGLRELGVSNLVMMTGDNEKTARAVAEAVGVDAYFAKCSPRIRQPLFRRSTRPGAESSCSTTV